MTTVVRNTAVRLSVTDGNKVKAELRDVGEVGSRSLKRIEEAARPASRALQALDGVTGDLRGSAEVLVGRLGPLGAGLLRIGPAGLAAGAALGGLALAMGKAKTALDKLDVLDDTAVRLGVTVEGLQALRYGFQQTGADVEVTEAAIERLGLSIGKVASLGEEAPEALLRAFGRLGIEIRDAEGRVKATETVLAEMAAGIAGVQSQAERIDLARALMGRGGAALLPLLQQGTAGLEAMKAEARALGVVIDEHLVKGAGAAADRLDAMQQVIDANLTQAFIDLAPLLISAAEGFAAIARAVGSVVDGFRALEDRSTRGLESRLATINEELPALQRRAEIARSGRGGIAGVAAIRDEQKLLAERAEIVALLEQRRAADKARVGLLSAPVELDTSGGDRKSSRAADRAAEALARDLAADAKVIADLNRQIETYGNERQQSIDAALSRMTERATATERAEVERLAAALYDKAKATEAATAIDREQVRVAFEAAAAARERADAEAERHWVTGLERGLREYSDEALNAAELAEDAVTGAFEGMEDAMLAFTATGKLEWATMVESMIADLGRLMLRMAVIAPLAKAMGGFDWASMFGGSAAYGTTGAGLSAAGRTSGGTNPGFLLGGVATGGAFDDGRLLAAYARGGIVGGPTIFPMARGYGLMGEAGPEAVMPLKRMASGNLGVEAGNNGVTINVINNAGAQVTTQQRREPSGGMTIDVMIDALEQQMAGRMVRPGTPLNGALRAAANPVRAR